MKPTSVMLKSYSGNKLPIVRQIQLQVEKKKHRVQAWVQIQQDAPVDFLLGTDLQPLLGFFLGEKEDKIEPTVTDDPAIHQQSAVWEEEKDTLQQGQVCLLQAVRIPANFLRLVPVEKIGPGSEEEALLEPSEELGEKGLVLEDSLLGTQPQGMMVVRNTTVHPNGVEVQPVDRPKEAPIRVALNRVRRCPHQMGNEFYPRAQGNECCRHREAMSFARDQPTDDAIEKATGQGEPDTDHWAGRLRSRNG